MKLSKLKLPLILLCTFGLGIFLGPTIFNNDKASLCDSKIIFINKDIACGSINVVRKTGYADFKKELLLYIDNEKNKGKVKEVSMYFRDLQRGPVFGINETDTFAAASLLKIPVAIMYFKIEEEKPGLLLQMFKYTEPSEGIVTQPYPPLEQLEVNKLYTIEKLIFNMLAYSDNTTAGLLVDTIYSIDGGPEIFKNTFKELGITQAESKGEEIVTVRGNASLFTFLYNSSYLTENSSNKLLEILSKTTYKEGITKYLPDGIIVAHKFGTRGDKEGVKQLHDCGIVYYPENPYLLCIMTKGSNWQDLSSVISNMSAMIYKEFNSRKL
ncbi:MAG: serine hydrolase [bacterium]|nr:serine hydrolase [bacterium]